MRIGRPALEVVVADQLELINGALARPRGRVLEVGCGRGELAASLAFGGKLVVAIDPQLVAGDTVTAPGLRFERVGIETFADRERFDAVAFTASLHHVADLDVALDRAAQLLAPGGAVVIDDFDIRAPDAAAALWFFEQQDLLAVAGLFDPARLAGKPSAPPLERWHAAHEPGLHDGATMIAAVQRRFADVAVTGGTYLYRYIAAGAKGPRAAQIATVVRDAEKNRIDLGLVPAVGLRIVARAPR
jgi:SAM-dependent methyltransferase